MGKDVDIYLQYVQHFLRCFEIAICASLSMKHGLFWNLPLMKLYMIGLMELLMYGNRCDISVTMTTGSGWVGSATSAPVYLKQMHQFTTILYIFFFKFLEIQPSHALILMANIYEKNQYIYLSQVDVAYRYHARHR